MDNKATPNLIMENARIIFRNFSGKETKFNREGNRNFCLILDGADEANEMIHKGWNVKTLRPREDDDEPIYYIQVAVNFGGNSQPKIFLVTRNGKTPLDEETVGLLDSAEIHNIDLTIRPYFWEVNGKTGIKGYLRSMYVTIEEDEFAAKYSEEEYPYEE